MYPEADVPVFEMGLDTSLDERAHIALADFPYSGELGRRAAPTNDHFLPALYAAALGDAHERLEFVNTVIQNGSISMRGFIIS